MAGVVAPHLRVRSDLARDLSKDPYHFDFRGLGRKVQERELEQALVDHLADKTGPPITLFLVLPRTDYDRRHPLAKFTASMKQR
jgi:hypothetical protein